MTVHRTPAARWSRFEHQPVTSNDRRPDRDAPHDLFDHLAHLSRLSTPDPELRYHGGPLDSQMDTWPLAAVPPQIPIAPSAGRAGGRYLLTGAAEDPDFFYRWTPDSAASVPPSPCSSRTLT